MGLVSTEIMNIRLKVCKFEPQTTMFYIQNASLFTTHTGLVWFYGISTIVGYLMPNPLHIYIYIY